MKKPTAILLIFLSLFVFLGNGHRIYAGNGDPKTVNDDKQEKRQIQKDQCWEVWKSKRSTELSKIKFYSENLKKMEDDNWLKLLIKQEELNKLGKNIVCEKDQQIINAISQIIEIRLKLIGLYMNLREDGGIDTDMNTWIKSQKDEISKEISYKCDDVGNCEVFKVGGVDADSIKKEIKNKLSNIKELYDNCDKESKKFLSDINKIENDITKFRNGNEPLNSISVPVIIDNSNFKKNFKEIIKKLNAKITNNGDKWKIEKGHEHVGYTSYYARGFPRFPMSYNICFLLLKEVDNLKNNDKMDRAIKICNADHSTVAHIFRYYFCSKTESKESDENFKKANNALYKNIYYLSHYYFKEKKKNNKVKIVILSVFDSEGNEISKYELAEKINYWIDIIMKIDSNAYIIFGIDISNGLTEDNLEERERSATSVVNLTAMAERAYLKKKPNKGQFVGAATFPVCSLKALLNFIIDHESM